MKKIGQFFKNKGFRKTVLDEKTIFYVFSSVIKKEYGKKGEMSVRPELFKNGKLFLNASSSNWAGEIWQNRGEIMEKTNKELNEMIIRDLKIKTV